MANPADLPRPKPAAPDEALRYGEISARRQEEWFGTAKVYPATGAPVPVVDPMTFYVLRCSTDARLFAVTDPEDAAKLPSCPNRGQWLLLKRFDETGQDRIGLSDHRARADIEERGFHVTRFEIASETSA